MYRIRYIDDKNTELQYFRWIYIKFTRVFFFAYIQCDFSIRSIKVLNPFSNYICNVRFLCSERMIFFYEPESNMENGY